MRKYQYQQFTTKPANNQYFNVVTSTTAINEPAPAVTKPERKKIEGQCFYCGKTGHRTIECRAKQRDEANGINKKGGAIPMKKQTDPDKPKYNPKLVCQICGYTGYSAGDCRQRVPKESISAYGKIPYTTHSLHNKDNKNRSQKLKRQQRPINQVEAVNEDDEQYLFSDEDINKCF